MGKRAQGGTRTGFQTPETQGTPENMPSTARSGTGTAESDGKGVHIVHTLFFTPTHPAGEPQAVHHAGPSIQSRANPT
ncbi:hypothetical protein GCM10027405_30850 [Arthrobacter alkaliphilus]